MGSFSKSLFPGLRLGYLVGSAPFISEARALRASVLRHPPGHIQRTSAHFLRLGHYDALINRMAKQYSVRRSIMANAIKKHQLEIAGNTSPEGGSSFWMKTPKELDTDILSTRLMKKGYLIEPGKNFFAPPNQPENYYRLAFSSINEEKIDADKKVVAELINKHFPDWRRVLNECQRYSVSGKIDSGILAAFSDVSVNDLMKNLKMKNFSEVRKWCVDNLDNDSGVLMRRIYDSLYEVLVPGTIPAAVLIIAKYQYQIAFVADQEINLLACLTEIMVECEFK